MKTTIIRFVFVCVGFFAFMYYVANREAVPGGGVQSISDGASSLTLVELIPGMIFAGLLLLVIVPTISSVIERLTRR